MLIADFLTGIDTIFFFEPMAATVLLLVSFICGVGFHFIISHIRIKWVKFNREWNP
jgi:hypothetical protein